MRTVITIITETEITEEIKIGEINLHDLLRKSDFLPLINQCLPKKILKLTRILSSISLKFRMLTMIMLLNTKKNRIMNFTKGTEMILGLLKDMILLKFSNKNRLLRKLAIMKHKDSNKWSQKSYKIKKMNIINLDWNKWMDMITICNQMIKGKKFSFIKLLISHSIQTFLLCI